MTPSTFPRARARARGPATTAADRRWSSPPSRARAWPYPGRAIDAGGPFSWVTADEAYGQVKYLRGWLERHDPAYVLATKCNDTRPSGSVSAHCCAHQPVNTRRR
jgi:hypothetical protein